jgi:mevalonate pyrophosphate decarboxylase
VATPGGSRLSMLPQPKRMSTSGSAAAAAAQAAMGAGEKIQGTPQSRTVSRLGSRLGARANTSDVVVTKRKWR